jgi:hypothetical protein
MARRLCLRTLALSGLLGAAAVVVETVHRTLNLNW